MSEHTQVGAFILWASEYADAMKNYFVPKFWPVSEYQDLLYIQPGDP
jgi:hypothetical protein